MAILSALHEASLGSGLVFCRRSPRSWFEPAVEAVRLKDFTVASHVHK